MVCKSHSASWVFVCLGILLFLNGKWALGADFPDKSVRVIVNYAPGSGADAEARGITPYVQKHLGVSVNIENVPGADGRIGLSRLWKSKSDGYTLIIHTTTMSLVGETLFNPEYRVADLSHIYSWSRTNMVLTVNIETYKTFDEFVKAGRERQLSAGLPGRGSLSHLLGSMLTDELGLKVKWVPFDGGGEALAALAGKHIDFAVGGSTTALPLVKGGKLRPLLVLADRKDSVYPDVPLAKNAGLKLSFFAAIRGVDGPPKMLPQVVKILEDAFAKAAKEPEYMAWAQQKRMLDVVPLDQEEYAKAIEEQQKLIEKYKDVLKQDK